MNISIVNFTAMPDREVQGVLRAVNRQIRDDFAPHWSMGAMLRLEGRIAMRPTKTGIPAEMRGDGVVYLWDQEDIAGAIGYHAENFAGVPFGFVFTRIAKQINEPWSVTLSHEVLEMILDANANSFAAGPHPKQPTRTVFHWLEACDAVQDQSYLIDGVYVSDFVLPSYFTPGNEPGTRNNFLGALKTPLPSFGIAPGGYVGFWDPATGQDDTAFADARGKARHAAKQARKLAGRGARFAAAVAKQRKRR